MCLCSGTDLTFKHWFYLSWGQAFVKVIPKACCSTKRFRWCHCPGAPTFQPFSWCSFIIPSKATPKNDATTTVPNSCNSFLCIYLSHQTLHIFSRDFDCVVCCLEQGLLSQATVFHSMAKQNSLDFRVTLVFQQEPVHVRSVLTMQTNK